MKDVKVVTVKEAWSEFTLEDGNLIMIKTKLIITDAQFIRRQQAGRARYHTRVVVKP